MELHDVDDITRVGVMIMFNRDPVTGESPKATVQRRSDSLFFDGASFSSVRNELDMTESDSNKLPGYYYYDFDQSVDSSEEEYLICIENTGTYNFIVDELYRFQVRLTPQTISSAVWDKDLREHTTRYTAGRILQQIRRTVNTILALIS